MGVGALLHVARGIAVPANSRYPRRGVLMGTETVSPRLLKSWVTTCWVPYPR